MTEKLSKDTGVEELLSSADPSWLWDGARGRIYWANDAALEFWNSDSLDELLDTELDHAMPALRRLKKLSLMEFPDDGRDERFVFWTNQGTQQALCNCLKLEVEGYGELLLLRAQGQRRERYSNGNGRGARDNPACLMEQPHVEQDERAVGLSPAFNGVARSDGINGLDGTARADRSDYANGQPSEHSEAGGEADPQAILLEIARQVRAESKYLDHEEKAQAALGNGLSEGGARGAGSAIAHVPEVVAPQNKPGLDSGRSRVASDEVEFLAKISHEVRTPLNSILGFSELMMMEQFGSLDNKKYAGYVADIHESAQLALSLINDLLSLSKMNAGQIEQTFEAVDLNEVARIALSIMRPQAEKGGITLKAELLSEPVMVEASLRSLKQIFLNLLSNAIKFTPRGGSVQVLTGFDGDRLSFARICDTGPGMTPSEIVNAMQPYAQLDTVPRHIEGTGLGLPITSALVEANGGTFVIELRIGLHGITLKVELLSEPVMVEASLRSLKQIFLNLLSNAIKFTPRGGSVQVLTGFDGDRLSFARICDTGPGMTPSEIVNAMQPYAQLDTVPRHIEGTGLGLPITSALVEANGGTFVIESEPGEGTEISLRFTRK